MCLSIGHRKKWKFQPQAGALLLRAAERRRCRGRGCCDMKKANFHQNLGSGGKDAWCMWRKEGETAGTRPPSVKGRADPREHHPAFAWFNKQECEPQNSGSRGPWLWGRGRAGRDTGGGRLAWEGPASEPGQVGCGRPGTRSAAGQGPPGGSGIGSGRGSGSHARRAVSPPGLTYPGQQARSASGDTHPGHSPAGTRTVPWLRHKGQDPGGKDVAP